MAVIVKHVGQYNAHAAAKRAGFKKGDIIVQFDGRDDLMNESDITSYVVTSKVHGDRVRVKLLRNGREQELSLPVQP